MTAGGTAGGTARGPPTSWANRPQARHAGGQLGDSWGTAGGQPRATDLLGQPSTGSPRGGTAGGTAAGHHFRQIREKPVVLLQICISWEGKTV